MLHFERWASLHQNASNIVCTIERNTQQHLKGYSREVLVCGNYVIMVTNVVIINNNININKLACLHFSLLPLLLTKGMNCLIQALFTSITTINFAVTSYQTDIFRSGCFGHQPNNVYRN